MRRGTLLFVGLALILAMPSMSASARERSLPGALFGIITAPVDAILGTAERIGRPIHRHWRPITQRSRPGIAAQPDRPPSSIPNVPNRRAPAGTASAKPAAVSATETSAGTARETAHGGQAKTSAATVGNAAVAAGASATTAASNASGEAAEPPVPSPVPRPRSAALAAPSAEPSQPTRETQSDSKVAAKAAGDKPAGGPPNTAREAFPLGVVGPLAWPGAYEDVVGFTLWPQKYGESLRTHGIGDVMNTLFKPGALASRTRADMARAADASGRSATAGAEPIGECSGLAALPDWPSAQVERSITLTAAQRTALDDLRAAIGEAVATIKAACRNEAAMQPTERIRALQNSLWTVRDAAIMIRAPLARFYGSLTNEQKKSFVVSGKQPDLRAMAMNADDAGKDEIARMCGMSKSSAWPSGGIDTFLKPTEAQRASLDNMQKKSFEMAQFLLASCLQPIPSTPTERLDAAVDRLTAIIFATSNINLALNDFYNQLTDQQKSKIISLGGR